ncbi:MAG: PQQ-dependent sugar dehydrogenase [Ferruginibacter sp.]
MEDEFGPRGGDEVNLIKPGNNYGWPTITYGIEYSGEKVGDGIQQKEGLQQPVYYWDPWHRQVVLYFMIVTPYQNGKIICSLVA